MRLIRLAHQKAIELEIFADGAGALGGASLNALRTQHGDGGHNRIGAQREPAHRLRLRAAVVDFLVKHPAHQARALAAQGGGAAINVVVAGAAGGDLELAQMERLLGQHLQQQFARRIHLQGRLSWLRHASRRDQQGFGCGGSAGLQG